MSQFPPAFDFLMYNEDRNRQYADTPDPVSAGPEDSPDVAARKRAARAISGINSFWYPIPYQGLLATPQSMRGSLVSQFYMTTFWNALHIGLIDDQDLACHVLDACVNQGQGVGIQMLQEAVNDLSGPAVTALAVDGVLGPETAAAVNGLDPAHLLTAYTARRDERYRAIGGPDLEAWLARAAET